MSKVTEVSPNAQPGSKNQLSKIHAMSIQLSNGTSLDWKDSNKRKHNGSGKKSSSKKGKGSKGKGKCKGKGNGKGSKGKGKGGSKGGDGAKAPAEGLYKIKGCTTKALWNYKQETYKIF